MIEMYMHGTLQAAECRFIIVEKTVVEVYNKFLDYIGVPGAPSKSGFPDRIICVGAPCDQKRSN